MTSIRKLVLRSHPFLLWKPCVCTIHLPAMANLTAVLNQIQRERTRLSAQLDRLNGAISALSSGQQPERQNAFGRRPRKDRRSSKGSVGKS